MSRHNLAIVIPDRRGMGHPGRNLQDNLHDKYTTMYTTIYTTIYMTILFCSAGAISQDGK